VRASLAHAPRHVTPPAAEVASLLALSGARIVLGPKTDAVGLPEPIAPRADTLFGPRGAYLARPEGPLFVCDTGHHRILIWRRAPVDDHLPADFVVGQPDFHSEGRNAKGGVGPTTLNVPTGVACEGDALAVADAWNHRVLIWHNGIRRSNQPPDVIVGQADREAGLANRGADRPRADTLNWCYGVALDRGRLFVADTGNRRVLIYDELPTRDGAAADVVIGQPDFTTRDENCGQAPGAFGLRWPHGMAAVGEGLLIADAGDNRVMGFATLPRRNGAPCDFVLGQRDFASVDHNQAAYLPTASAVNMPYGLAVLGQRLVVADTANSRLVGFDLQHLTTGVDAQALAAQPTFTDKGDNRWSVAKRDSLCWPYGVAASGATLAIADSGNNRVLLWDAAP